MIIIRNPPKNPALSIKAPIFLAYIPKKQSAAVDRTLHVQKIACIDPRNKRPLRPSKLDATLGFCFRIRGFRV